MENQVVRRRVNIIASHFGSPEDLSAAATHLFPMGCSNSLNSVIWRCDSKMYFARQTSSSQPCFMRPAANEQVCHTYGNYAESTPRSKSSGSLNKDLYAYEAPMFSRPSITEPSMQNVEELQWLQQACNFHQPAPDPPTFARPSPVDYHAKEKTEASKVKGFEWMPKMDVAESGCNYVVTIELPGARASNIRVEVNNQNLRVTGYRSIDWGKVASCSIDSTSAYHRREISPGPYEIVWPLPKNVNKENISAELVEGLLLINIPKLSEARRQLKRVYI
ncbi:uncharacterized protein LOC113770952 isoform X1 [Coffea eugenioides]|uniref:uncharacterized protein LOC113770952 isoform X1 n=1 Tax=Coffea eugenioides TaxID=49369 RepID=UPI000F607A97|nr:uncharacterized protein LOC113770952 isoform X1 [Coffea eugenioides]